MILDASHGYRQTACMHAHECIIIVGMLYFIASMSFIYTDRQLWDYISQENAWNLTSRGLHSF